MNPFRCFSWVSIFTALDYTAILSTCTVNFPTPFHSLTHSLTHQLNRSYGNPSVPPTNGISCKSKIRPKDKINSMLLHFRAKPFRSAVGLRPSSGTPAGLEQSLWPLPPLPGDGELAWFMLGEGHAAYVVSLAGQVRNNERDNTIWLFILFSSLHIPS